MIPKIIHYIWLGQGKMPELVQRCLASWRQYMPESKGWHYCLWNETSIAKAIGQESFEAVLAVWPIYVRQAYEAKKYAFVSDYVRLWALEREGGVYMDTDVEVQRFFLPLLADTAFIGFEESLAHLPGTCVFGSEPHSRWLQDMLNTYNGASFVHPDGSYDFTTNVQRMGQAMVAHGLVPNGKEQYLAEWGLHVYDHHHFSPITSTRVMRKSKDTYCIHHFAGSWTNGQGSWWRNNVLTREVINALVQVKRLIIGKR